MNISLIVPTRGRYQLLLNCINSFVDNAKYKDKVEIIVLMDSDDYPQTFSEQWPQYVENWPCSVISIMRKRQGRKIVQYDNWAARISSGKYVWILNDDLTCLTKNWDSKIVYNADKYLEDKPDGVLYGMTNDCGPNVMHPVVSRDTIKVMNGIFPAEFSSACCDTWLHKIFNNLEFNRILDLTEVVKVQPINMADKTAMDIKNMSQALSLSEEEFNAYLSKLNNYIKGKEMILGGGYYDHSLRLLEMWVENFGEGKDAN